MTTRSTLSRVALALTLTAASGLAAQNAPTTVAARVPRVTPEPPQQRVPPRSAASIGDSIAVAGDSVAALAYLDLAIKRNPHDAAALHRRGMIAWNMGRATRREAIQPLDAINRLIQADTALRMATVYAPDSARYWIDLTRFALNSGNVFIRTRAEPYMERALQAAERSRDSITISEAADELGMMWWRRYEASANKAMLSGKGRLVVEGGRSKSNDPGKARPWKASNAVDQVDQFLIYVKPPTGGTDYSMAARNLFRARNANTLNHRARRHQYMALAEKRQWDALEADASAEVKKAPWDYDAWLALGLANTRLERTAQAAAAFDSAFAVMTPEARESFTRISRILPPPVDDSSGTVRVDAGRYKIQSEAERRATTELYWSLADPLSKTKLNEDRVEFYARVAYADIRWTSDDLDERGADSDRGDIFVRFGPPDREALITYREPDSNVDKKYLVWVYDAGKVFYFDAPPSFGVARFPNDVRSRVAEVLNSEAARWDNVNATTMLDTMTVRLVRFRAGRDSLDVVTAVAIPVARMMKGAEVAGTLPFDINVRAFDPQARVAFEDSVSTSVTASALPALINRTWVRRVGPEASVMRIDAFQPDTRRAARGLGMVDATRATGFGMSDVLLGTLGNTAVTPARWRDVPMEPAVGYFRLSDPVGLAWELYDLAEKDGQSHYRISIDVQRIGDPGLRAFSMRVLGRVSDAITGDSKGVEKLALAFDRTEAARSVVVDYFSLAFSNVMAGNYRVTLGIKDLVSGRTTERTTMIRFIE